MWRTAARWAGAAPRRTWPASSPHQHPPRGADAPGPAAALAPAPRPPVTIRPALARSCSSGSCRPVERYLARRQRPWPRCDDALTMLDNESAISILSHSSSVVKRLTVDARDSPAANIPSGGGARRALLPCASPGRQSSDPGALAGHGPLWRMAPIPCPASGQAAAIRPS